MILPPLNWLDSNPSVIDCCLLPRVGRCLKLVVYGFDEVLSWLLVEGYREKDKLVKEVLMIMLVMHTEEDDIVLHIMKTGMLMLVVEFDVGGMTADDVDKLTCSSDDVQPKQVDLRFAHALSELHWHDTHVDPDRREVYQR
nr:hypothetical protein [Tanacetum cinerariifolium]